MYKTFITLMFIVISHTASTTQQMVVMRGVLLSSDNCTSYPTTSFLNCTLTCSNTNSCAINQLQNGSCFLCGINWRESVESISFGNLIGIKARGWSNFTQVCLSIRHNFTASTTTKTGDFMEISTTVTSRPKTCSNGWTIFQRGNASWCLKVMLSEEYSRNNYSAAWNTCQKLNSTLSGLNSVQEQVFVRDSAYQLMAKTINNLTANPRIWIDGTRKPQCSSANWTRISSCTGIKSFQFTDPTLISPAGYLWYTNEPNGDLNEGVIQSCLQMIITKNRTSIANGKMDDIGCNYGSPILMALCGQLAA